jgi:predicted amidohydrolase
MKVAAIQFAPTWKDVPGNVKRIVGLVRDAALAGAKLIVLPELCTTGYSFMSPDEARPFAESPRWLDDEAIRGDTMMYAARALTKQLGIALVFGFVEVDLGTGRLYNSQMYLGPDGYNDCYRKINLWGNDFLAFHMGQGNPPIVRLTVDGKEKKIGLLICRDVRDKKDEHWDSFYQRGDADIVAFSANWGEGGFPANAWTDFVKDNHTTLIVSNRYGEEGTKPNKFGGGGTCIITPKGNDAHPNGVYCDGLVWHQDCIVYADV